MAFSFPFLGLVDVVAYLLSMAFEKDGRHSFELEYVT